MELGSKIKLVDEIIEILMQFSDEISLNTIPCREGKLISINPRNQKVKFVNVWKIKESALIDLSNYTLNKIKERLDEVKVKQKQGFDKD